MTVVTDASESLQQHCEIIIVLTFRKKLDCVCVCGCVCMHLHTHTHIHTYWYIHTHTNTHTNTYKHTSIVVLCLCKDVCKVIFGNLLTVCIACNTNYVYLYFYNSNMWLYVCMCIFACKHESVCLCKIERENGLFQVIYFITKLTVPESWELDILTSSRTLD